ncbi:MAG TPA: hypothetical protein VMS60_15850 [Solirubrobacterales bacterium]|nr:hypothetical protein [Solirubrobacterales bacterium]
MAAKADVGEAHALTRLQGVHSDIEDLVLRGGKGLDLEVGVAITPTPSITRTIGGASSIDLSVFDPERRLLKRSLLAEAWNAEIDGLHFRYPGALSKQGDTLTLTLEDRWIAKLREFKGPVKARREEMTRAEFILMLVEEACPGLRFICPQLHKIQPIASGRQAKKAKDDAQANRGKGLGAAAGLTVKGEKATSDQVDVGDRALRTAASHDASAVATLALIEALAVESVFGEEAANLLGMTPETKAASQYSATSVEEACTGFLLGYVAGHEGAIDYVKNHPDARPYEVAQGVQRSGAGAATNGAGNYGEWESEARRWLEAFDGGEYAGADFDASEPYLFEVGKKEDYWEAIKRLAKQVNWRCFLLADRMIYMPETELLQSKVRLAIDDELLDDPDGGVENVDFDFDGNDPVTEVTVTALIKQWKPPPGSVVTLADHGPASIGFGSAPARVNSKGQKMGISGNRNAVTGEGKARYLVSTIEVPLIGDPAQRLATITLRKPTAPLPEPRNQDSSGGAAPAASGSSQKAQELHDWCEAQIGKPYDWGAVGPGSYDCSGFVSAGLIEVDLLGARLTTSGFTTWGEAGEGEFITVHGKAGTGNPRTEHVVIEVLGDLFECGGISGGVGKPNYSAEDLAAFSTKRHPKGL